MRGKFHEFLGMTLYFKKKIKLIIDIRDYIQSMLDKFEKYVKISLQKYQQQINCLKLETTLTKYVSSKYKIFMLWFINIYF